MRRFVATCGETSFGSSSVQASLSGASLPVLAGLSSCPSSFLSSSSDPYGSTTMSVQRRGLRNLHRYRHARHKSLVKDRYKFSRNWMLQANNNYELVEHKGHEREATEMFGNYWLDSNRDHYVLSTTKLEDLPADQRLAALTSMMRHRWKVKDGNGGYDKAKMMLSAVECFAELRQLGAIGVFAQLPEPDQDTFLQYVESLVQIAQKCVHRHPNAIAMILRAAVICDEMRCNDKRDEVLRVAERCTHSLGKSYAFEREGQPLEVQPPTPMLSNNFFKVRIQAEEQIKQRYPQRPDLLYSRIPRNMVFWDGRKFVPLDEKSKKEVDRPKLV